MWVPLYIPVANPDFPESFKKRPADFREVAKRPI